MKPDFFSPMTMGKTAWRIASDDLSPAFPRRSFSAPKNRSGNIARPLYRFLSLRRHADITPISCLSVALSLTLIRSAETIPIDRCGGPRLSPIRF